MGVAKISGGGNPFPPPPPKKKTQPIAGGNSLVLRCFWPLTNACKVTMQVKRDIHVGKTILHKLHVPNNIIQSYMCLCGVSTLFCMICCLFSNCNKNYTTLLRSLYTCTVLPALFMCHILRCPYSS